VSCRPISALRHAYLHSPLGMRSFLWQAEHWFRKAIAYQDMRQWRVYVDDGRIAPPASVVVTCDSIDNISAVLEHLSRSVRRARVYSSVDIAVRVLTPEPARLEPIEGTEHGAILGDHTSPPK